MKKFFLTLSSIALIAILYYLFLKPSDFEVNFKSKTLPGDLIQTLRLWSRSLDSAQVINVDSLKSIVQTIYWNNRSYVTDWYFNAWDDSTTTVNVKISEPGHSALNKFLIPFTSQPIESDAEEMVRSFYDILKEHLRITSVKILGETELDSSFCVCSHLETKQIEKAKGMMKDYALLASFIDTRGLKVNGPPMVRIVEWKQISGQIKFDFCFPVQRIPNLPDANIFTYKSFDKISALKAEYRGNYITSDRAWYELLNFAEKKGYKISGAPIELFFDNPSLGLNETNWKAEVYIPIIK